MHRVKEGFPETQRNILGSLSDLRYAGTEIKQKRPSKLNRALGKENRTMSPEGKKWKTMLSL